ncbi:MAG: hypothetical protein ACIALR_04835 [Blastopirellula sp. JB062]
MNDWLGDGENADRWRKFLRSDALETQIELGDEASAAELEKILTQYERDEIGLDLPQFESVRTKIASWIQEIGFDNVALADEIAQAQDEFQPVDPAQAATAKTQLEGAVKTLDAYLQRGAKGTEQGWKKYLRWKELTEQLAADSPDLSILERSYQRFHSGAKGLEKRQFAEVRRALRRYIDMQFFATTEQYEAMYDKQLGLLAENLKKYDEQPTADGAAVIGAQLGWMAQGGQIPSLIARTRRSLNHPNLYLNVSERFIGYGIRRQVNDVAPVRDNILGTDIHGMGRTVGEVRIDLVPNDDAAQLQLILDAVTTTNNVGYNGPATIYSSGVTSVLGKKTFLVDPEGVQDFAATANCRTNSTLNSIQANMRLVQNIATNKAYQQKSQAEAIASRRAEQRVARRLDAETVDLLRDANARLRKEVRQPLDSRDEFPEVFQISSTNDWLNVVMQKANRFQLAAPTPPPAPATIPLDIAVRMHESLPTNMAEVLLGGVKLTDVKLVELLKERGTEIPEELQITPEKDPWSITFDYQRPIEIRFGKDQVEIAIRGVQFTRGDGEFNDPARIRAVYSIKQGENGAHLTRQGDVSVEFLSQERQGIRVITLKTFLTKKFSALFEPEIVGEGLKLKGRWQGAGPMQLDQLVVEDGWASLGWIMPPKKSGKQDLASTANSVK